MAWRSGDPMSALHKRHLRRQLNSDEEKKVTLAVQKWDHIKKEWQEPEATGDLDEMSDLEAHAIVESAHTPVRISDPENKDEYRIYYKGQQVVNDW